MVLKFEKKCIFKQENCMVVQNVCIVSYIENIHGPIQNHTRVYRNQAWRAMNYLHIFIRKSKNGRNIYIYNIGKVI